MALSANPYAALFAAPRRKRDPFTAPADPLGRDGSRIVEEDGLPDLEAGLEAARRDWRQGASLTGLLGEPFELHGSVGRNKANRPGDVFKVQTLLHREGYLDAGTTDGPTGFFGLYDDEPIKRFQQDHGLKPDGYLDPGGETITRIRDFYDPPPAGQERQMPNNMLRAAEEGEKALPTAVERPQPMQRPVPRDPALDAPPPYRAGVFQQSDNIGIWQDFRMLTDRLPQVSDNERFAYPLIFAAEGGYQTDKKSYAASGVLPSTLSRLHQADAGRAIQDKPRRLEGIDPAKPPEDLTLGERAQVYRAVIDEGLEPAGGIAALNRMPDREAAAALADTFFMHGGARGTKDGKSNDIRDSGPVIAQKAVREVQQRIGQEPIALDGRFGPKSLDAFRDLSDDPETRRMLLEELARQRKAVRQYEPERTRIDQFKFSLQP